MNYVLLFWLNPTMMHFIKTQELKCGWYTDSTQLRNKGMNESIAHLSSLHAVRVRGGRFHMAMFGRYACCVSDSHHPTQRDVVLARDDSSFMAAWNSRSLSLNWGLWHQPYLQLVRAQQQGSPSKTALGFWRKLVRCGTGVDTGSG